VSAYIDEAQVEIMTVENFRESGQEYTRERLIAPDGEAGERKYR